jgi:hypothetical protein
MSDTNAPKSLRMNSGRGTVVKTAVGAEADARQARGRPRWRGLAACGLGGVAERYASSPGAPRTPLPLG